LDVAVLCLLLAAALCLLRPAVAREEQAQDLRVHDAAGGLAPPALVARERR
jgi:hypothetical protein